MQKLQRSDTGLKYELYDGHIFSPDMQRAIVMIDSPYGASETENNTQLINMLQGCGKRALAHAKNLDVHIIGGPVIAVGNASQIKSDSILSVIIAVTLIMALLLFTFTQCPKHFTHRPFHCLGMALRHGRVGFVP